MGGPIYPVGGVVDPISAARYAAERHRNPTKNCVKWDGFACMLINKLYNAFTGYKQNNAWGYFDTKLIRHLPENAKRKNKNCRLFYAFTKK